MNAAAGTGALDVQGARLHYEVRGAGPLLALVGAPMDADAFAPLAERLAADHTVLTMDPRGIHRSGVDDANDDSTPETRAEDLFRLIRHLDAGPAAVFGSSGGAVTALALAQSHPEVVHVVIAHEPPLHALLPADENLRARTDDCCSTYLSGDVVGGWIKFFEIAGVPIPAPAVQHMFGGDRDRQVVADERFWFAHELRPSTRWQPDVALLRALSTRILVGIGETSAGQLTDRTSRALAAALEVEPTLFPGGHTGFVEDPQTFATRLETTLQGA